MIINKKKTVLLYLLICTGVILNCAVGTSTLKVDYMGDLPENESIKELPATVFIVNLLEDDRDYIDRVANKKNTYGMTMGKAVTETDVRTIIQNAIIKEFERYNHKCYASGNPQDAEIIIDGTLKEFWVGPKANFFTVETTATISANVILKNAKNSEILFSRNFTGQHSSEKAMAWTGTWEDHLNKALMDFIQKMTTHADLINACKINE
ncbi:hypothetical protein JW835_09200 [bacterium]|nr:hypothetical protein [bacterium]